MYKPETTWEIFFSQPSLLSRHSLADELLSSYFVPRFIVRNTVEKNNIH